MKVKLFSHIDLDGYGCNYICKNAYQIDNLDCENLSYDNCDIAIKHFFTSGEYKNYNELIITDLSIKEDTAALIDRYLKNAKGLKVHYCDHHKSSLYANKYEWAVINEEIYGKETCATEIFFEICSDVLKSKCNNTKLSNIEEIVYFITLYDTWRWKTEEECGEYAVQLNDLLYLLGAEEFINQLMKKNFMDLINDNKALLDFRKRDIAEYINRKEKEIIPFKICNYTAGIVFADRYLSQLGDILGERHPEYDLIAMITSNSVSYRTKKDNVDCCELAAKFGGGGHPQSSGNPIDINVIETYLKNIFKESDE